MRTKQSLFALLLAFGGLDAQQAEDPPWKRVLQGEDARKATELEKQIVALGKAGMYAEAVPAAETVWALRKKGQGERHWQTENAKLDVETFRRVARLPEDQQRGMTDATRWMNQAAILEAEGNYQEAEPLLRKTMAMIEGVLGPRHPNIATSYNNLAGNLGNQARYAEAEALYRKAIALREERLGLKHPYTAVSYNNLASNLNDQGKHAEAERFYNKAIKLQEEVLGPRHPHTAASYNNLAHHLRSQGRFAEAETLLRKALTLFEELLGPTHPHTAAAYNNLASTLNAQSKHTEAETLLRKAFALQEELLGPRHPHLTATYNNLASSLHDRGKYAEAETLYLKSLTLLEDLRGSRHPDTATGYNNLAENLDAQGKHAEAETLLRKALTLQEEVLGSQHPSTATSYNNLALNLDAQGKHTEAEMLHRKAMLLREERLGSKHPDTANSYNNLAFNLDTQSKYTEAELLYRKALTLQETVLGSRHPDTANTYGNLAVHLNTQGRYAEAESLFRKSLTLREELLGSRHSQTATSYDNLASNLSAQGKHAEAEKFSRAAVAAQDIARLHLAATGFDRAAASGIAPHLHHARCLAALGQHGEAWQVVESGLAQGLLDDLTAQANLSNGSDTLRRLYQRNARLAAIHSKLTPLLVAEKLSDPDLARRDALLEERNAITAEADKEAADLAAKAVYPLRHLQKVLPPEAALVLWLETTVINEHNFPYACVVRHDRPPVWERLKGTGPRNTWTRDDDTLPARLRTALTQNTPEATLLLRRLAVQRLEPLTRHLNGVTRLVVVPVGDMAGTPIEALTDRYTVTYAPSCTVFARLVEGRPSRQEPSLLALGDPVFTRPTTPRPTPPSHGLLALQILPQSNAAKAGLKEDDVLLTYGGTPLKTLDDLQTRTAGEPILVQVWRGGKTLELTVAPGRLGVSFHREPAPVVLKQRQETAQLLVAQRGSGWKPLPGTRREVESLQRLFPSEKAEVLLGSAASEQRLDSLVASGKLKNFRLLHFATHGDIDRVSPARSALLLARDKLPDELSQVRKGEKVYTGRLSVEAVSKWQLDADLVTLSACETGQGKSAGGDGLLGFAHMFLKAGARSLVLSQWKVDDAATALLMTRFYENFLGKREGLKGPMPKGGALREAQMWLRELTRPEAERLTSRLGNGVLRGTVDELKPTVKPAEKGDRPYAHPYYWAAFSLFGDPE